MPPPYTTSAAQNQWLVAQDANGALYYNPGRNANNAVTLPPAAPGPRIHFKVEGKKAAFEFKGPDNSPITGMALEIAARVAGV